MSLSLLYLSSDLKGVHEDDLHDKPEWVNLRTTLDNDKRWTAAVNKVIPMFTDLFRSATNVSDLSAKVKAVIYNNSAGPCFDALAFSLIQVAVSTPHQTDLIVKTISRHIRPYAQQLDFPHHGQRLNFDTIFTMRYVDLTGALLVGEGVSQRLLKAIKPTNPLLPSTLLSATMIRHGLIDSTDWHDPYHFLEDILQLGVEKDKLKKPKMEVRAVSALLLLCLAGKSILSSMRQEAGEGAGLRYEKESILKALKEHICIHHTQGQLLLQDTIDHVEGDFLTDFTAEQTWSRLFPSSP